MPAGALAEVQSPSTKGSAATTVGIGHAIAPDHGRVGGQVALPAEGDGGVGHPVGILALSNSSSRARWAVTPRMAMVEDLGILPPEQSGGDAGAHVGQGVGHSGRPRSG